MNDPRRYDETEVAEILRRATEADERPPPAAAAGAGLTLTEIQQIGREVGIEPPRIEHAARALDLPAPEPGVTFLGAPRSVSRLVPLDRNLDDDEWMRLVVMLRETFGARGKIETVGPLRTWYNGNLQVHVEPWEGGHRVRMGTLKGNITERSIGGLFFLGMAAMMGLLIFLKKGLDPGLVMSGFFAVAGFGMIGAARLTLPKWAAKRQAQMESIAEEIPRLMGE